MKIGLLTYHHSTNIGAMMQTYATCRALKELGHEVVIVDIRQPEKQHHGIMKIVVDVIYFKRDKDVGRFKKNFYPPLTRRYYSIDELRSDPPKVDCLVVGSDQTWNPEISKEMAMAYFLDFGPDNIKRISYASSFGAERWDQSAALTKEVDKALHKLSGLSVRESTGVGICRNVFGLDAKLVVDPTLLFQNYNEITGNIRQRDELLCYKLRRDENFYSNIENLKDSIGLPARLLNNLTPKKGLRYKYPPSVAEWISHIGGARFVLTDSFHGVAFSLLYKRQFAVIRCHDGRDSRFEDLLKELGISNRVFDNMQEMIHSKCYDNIIDYSVVEPKLQQIRELSWSYLKTALNNK